MPVWAQDLLAFAQAVYLVDRVSPRSDGVDRWTRELALSVQVIDAARWSGPAGGLASAVAIALTGDQWSIDFQDGAQEAQVPLPGLGRHSDLVDPEIALFSGGLDSAAYVVERAAIPGPPLLLVAHDHPKLQAIQQGLVDRIPQPKRRLVLRQYSLQPTGFSPHEGSSRSRGLLYAAAGIYVSAARGASTTAVPENGYMALNLPLTTSRSGSLSTRSTHPWTLHLLNRLVDAIGGDVRIVNPYQEMTKGEVVARAHHRGATPEFLAGTTSCGDHSANRSDPGSHCGYCLPCLVRRAAMVAAVGTDPTEYAWSIPAAGKDHGRHLRALHHHLRREVTIEDLIGDMPFPDGSAVRAALPVVERSRVELTALLDRPPIT